MGRRIIRVEPEIVLALLTEGNRWRVNQVLGVEEGVPVGTRLVSGWYNHLDAPDGYLCLLLEHPSWPKTKDGEPHPFVHIAYCTTNAPDRNEGEVL